MKIAIEAQRIFRKKKHGMDFVILEVIKCLQRIDTENQYYIMVAPGPDRCIEATDNFHIVEVRMPSYPLWEQVGLPLALRRINPDVVHCTSDTAPISKQRRMVLTLHDIIFLEPQKGKNRSIYQSLGRLYRKWVVPRVLHNCDMIITVSEYERERIIDFLRIEAEDIKCVYNGYGSDFYYREDYGRIAAKYVNGQDYIFFLGNTDPKKNVAGTLRAYSEYLKLSKKKMPLLIADIGESRLNSILRAQGITEIRKHIVRADYINHAELPYVYSGAKIFLYTSYRESFGIPLLEAMACGTPVVTGITSSLPEIAGEYGGCVDVRNTRQIADKMLEIENDDVYSATLVSAGKERVKNFSWENTAREYLEIYKSQL